MAKVYRRLTVYAGRNVDVTEATILTAQGTGTQFKVTDHPNLAGWAPYLGECRVTYGEIEPLSKRYTLGQASIRLLDVRTNAVTRTMLERWVTQFLGDAKGRNQFLGCKFYLEISTDNAVTWSPWFVGRIDQTDLDDPNWYTFTGPDLAADLDVECFGDRPSRNATGVIDPVLLPVGVSGTYAQVAAATPFSGTVAASPNTNVTTARVITLDGSDVSRKDNLLTADLWASAFVKVQGLGLVANWQAGVGGIAKSGALRARVRVSGVFTNKELQVLQLICVNRSDGHYAVKQIVVTELKNADGTAATNDPFYQAFDTGTVPNGTAITNITLRLGTGSSIAIQVPRSIGAYGVGGSGWAPGVFGKRASGFGNAPLPFSGQILTGDLAPMTFLADLLNGHYSALYQPDEKTRNLIPTGKSVGDPKFPVNFDTTAGSNWDQLVNATNRTALPNPIRFYIDKAWRRFDFIEKQFGQTMGIGYRFQPILDGSSVPQSRFVPVDLRLPTAAALSGIPTIADSDLVADQHPQWSQGRSAAVSELSVTGYEDVIVTAEQASGLKDAVPAVPASLVQPSPYTVTRFSLGETRSIGIGSKPFAVDAQGFRFTREGSDTQQFQHAQARVDGYIEETISLYKTMFGAGGEYVVIPCRRSSTAAASLWPGDWCYTTASVLPSAGINKRGDTRLCLVVSRQEDGPTITLKAISVGAGAQCNTPTIGTPTTMSGNTFHGITVSVTLNAQGDPVEVRYLVDTTKSLTTPPADTDPRWTVGLRVTATGSYSIQNLPSGTRVLVQARSVSAPAGTSVDLKIPSAYVAPSGTKYVDLGSLPAVASLTVTPGTILTTSTVVGSWAIPAGAEAFDQEIYLDGVLQTVLPAGSTAITLNPYITLSGHTYTLGHRFRDNLTGTSTLTTTTFTTPGGFGGPTLSAPSLVTF